MGKKEIGGGYMYLGNLQDSGWLLSILEILVSEFPCLRQSNSESMKGQLAVA